MDTSPNRSPRPLKPSEREVAAARRLAEAMLEFSLALEAGRTAREAEAERQREAERRTREQRLDALRPASASDEGAAGADLTLINSRQARELLQISDRALWALTAPRGPIPALRIGDRRGLRYRLEDMKAFIESRLVTADTPPV